MNRGNREKISCAVTLINTATITASACVPRFLTIPDSLFILPLIRKTGRIFSENGQKETAVPLEELKAQIEDKHLVVNRIREEIGKVLVGQRELVDGLLMGIFTRGHILIEGVPGLAKTSAVKALADTVRADFKRIQFTPDLLPADLVGTEIYRPKTGDFSIKKGPLFNNIILADEINRAPSKVQSALLEAMQERQVTIGDSTFPLADPFLVMATQNPIEQEGTYPLPEAQVDRFMLKILIDYPDKSEEKEIMKRVGFDLPESVQPVIDPAEISAIGGLINSVYMDEKLKDYIVDLVFATRTPAAYHVDVANYIQFGASPRATIFLSLAARAHAFLQGRAYVTPQDVKTIAPMVLRHRILLTYEAEAEDVDTDQIIGHIFDSVEVP
jgi:MoxR-like ATPase